MLKIPTLKKAEAYLSELLILILDRTLLIENIMNWRIDKFDFKFIKYIWDFPKSSGQRNRERLNRCKDKNIIIFSKRSASIKVLRELRLSLCRM